MSALLVVTTGQLSANAMTNATDGCNDDTISWQFSSSSNWTTQRKDWVRSAFNSIETALDYDGSKLVELTETGIPTSAVVVVTLNSSGATNLGVAYCNLYYPTMNLNLDYADEGAPFFYQVARHEMLHMVGLDHAGADDSVPTGDGMATMSTCTSVSAFRSTSVLDRDSEVGVNWMHSSLSNRQVTANLGFEDEINDWGGTNGTLVASTVDSFDGSGNASFLADGTSADSYIKQTVRIWTGNDSDVEFRAYMRARVPADLTNNVRAALYRRGMNESGDNVCEYPRGLKNPNSASVATTYILLSQSDLTSVGTSWTAVAGPWVAPPTSYDGFELQMRAYGNATGEHTVRFDNVRAEER